MLKRIIQVCLFILGGTLGVILIPKLLIFIGADDIIYVNNPYVTAILGGLIFFLLTFWAVDYVIDFIKWIEEVIVKVPIGDIISGTLGLIAGLLVAFLINYAFTSINFPIINTVVPIITTLLFGYLGFQVFTIPRISSKISSSINWFDSAL